MIIIAISSIKLYIHCAQVLMLKESITCTCLILLNWRALNFTNNNYTKNCNLLLAANCDTALDAILPKKIVIE